MRIQELCQHQAPQDREQAKCSTMTEEGHTKTGMNGSIDGSGSGTVGVTGAQSDPEQHGPTAGGGRLKFFKDGKFILELARAREGERNMWVSVPRKTFWPPHASAATTPPSHRQESSTSLSVSDDNSSVQSSPWQRDHSWKQSTPRCNVSSEMTFFYCRKQGSLRKMSTAILRKRRRPFDNSNSVSRSEPEGDVTGRIDGSVQSEGAATARPVAAEAEEQLDIKKENGQAVARKPSGKDRRKLSDIIHTLSERKKQNLNNTVPGLKAVISSSRHEQMVSPRKRILREFERVTIDDLSNKRTRAKTVAAAQQNTGSTSGSSPRRAHNGSAESVPTPTKNSSSYSITSLLGHRVKEEEPPSPGTPSEHNRAGSRASPSAQHSATNNMPSPKSVANFSPKLGSHYSDRPDMSSSPEYCRYMSPHQSTVVHGSPTHTLSPPPDVYKSGAPPPYRRAHESPNHVRQHHRQQQNIFSSPLQGLAAHQKSPQYYAAANSRGRSPTSPHSPDERFAQPTDKVVRRSSPKGFGETRSPPKGIVETIPSGVGLPPAGYTYVPPYVYPPPGPAYVPHPAAFYGAAYRNPYLVPYGLDPVTRPSSPHYRPPIVAAHSWTSLTQVHAQDTLRDDISSDMPLNLSKHA